MEREKTPVLLLTGYLGSGKTTLLNRILSNEKGIKFAVIVNDIGEVNIDARLIEQNDVVYSQDGSLVPLQNGCICCTLQTDLIKQLSDLIAMKKFDYIVIEASGICEPAPIAQTICSIPQIQDPQTYDADGIPVLDCIVTVVDALRMKDEFGSGMDLLKKNIGDEDIENLVIQQIEFCNIVLLNKAAEVEPGELRRIREIVHALQPKAEIIDCNYGDVPFEKILNTGMFDFMKVATSAAWIEKVEGEVCIVTTTEDLIDVVDSSKVDSLGNYGTKVALSQGSFRECAEKDTPVWILFEKDGTYNLRSPLRIKSDKTVDGRGRDIRITGMGVLTNESSNLIFENLTFTAPAITAHDTTSRRALSIHNRTHHVWVDHCTFEEYPLILVDVKRGSNAVTLSWNRFENAQSGILFGLEPDIFIDSAQTLTLHHNYFSNLELRGVLARRGKIHAYNNFIYGVGDAGMECSDYAACYIEGNVYNNDVPVRGYRLKNEDGSPDESTRGFAYVVDNWYGRDGENSPQEKSVLKPDYQARVEKSGVELAVRVRNESGPR